MANKQKYIEHITEAEPKARLYGDQQYLEAGDKDKKKGSKIKKDIAKKMKK